MRCAGRRGRPRALALSTQRFDPKKGNHGNYRIMGSAGSPGREAEIARALDQVKQTSHGIAMGLKPRNRGRKLVGPEADWRSGRNKAGGGIFPQPTRPDCLSQACR